jgi:hypothetical protein
MSGASGSSQITGALGQHPSGSLVTVNIIFADVTTYRDRGHGAHYRCLQLHWWPLPEILTAPPGGSLLEIPTTPPGGSPSTSSTSVVAAAENTDSTPSGVLHRRLQLWWWSLPKIPTAPPRRPVIDVFFIFDGGCCQTFGQHHQEARHRRLLHLRWWLLPDFGQHPQEVRHRHLQLWWWPLLKIPTTPLRGPVIDVFFIFGGGCFQNSASTPLGAHHQRLQLRW